MTYRYCLLFTRRHEKKQTSIFNQQVPNSTSIVEKLINAIRIIKYDSKSTDQNLAVILMILNDKRQLSNK